MNEIMLGFPPKTNDSIRCDTAALDTRAIQCM